MPNGGGEAFLTGLLGQLVKQQQARPEREAALSQMSLERAKLAAGPEGRVEEMERKKRTFGRAVSDVILGGLFGAPTKAREFKGIPSVFAGEERLERKEERIAKKEEREEKRKERKEKAGASERQRILSLLERRLGRIQRKESKLEARQAKTRVPGIRTKLTAFLGGGVAKEEIRQFKELLSKLEKSGQQIESVQELSDRILSGETVSPEEIQELLSRTEGLEEIKTSPVSPLQIKAIRRR